jgi:hypothetical protein
MKEQCSDRQRIRNGGVKRTVTADFVRRSLQHHRARVEINAVPMCEQHGGCAGTRQCLCRANTGWAQEIAALEDDDRRRTARNGYADE